MSHYGFNEDRSKVEIYSKDEVDELIEESGGGYTLPTMSASTKGGAKLGDGLSISEDTLSLSDEAYTSAEKTKLAGIESGAQAHKAPTSSEVTTALGFTPMNAALKGAASGVAELDAGGLVPSTQLPSYVDDVIEGYYYQGAFYEDQAHTTAITGEQGKIYVDLAENSSYRWSGSAYISISNPIDIASQAEAEAGVDNTKMMTPLRVKQAIDENAYELPAATNSTLGGVKPDGTTITADQDGTLHGVNTYTLPTMSASTKGGAKLGEGLQVENDTLAIGDLVTESATGGAVHEITASGWAEQDGTPTPSSPVPIEVARGRNLLNENSYTSLGKILRNDGTEFSDQYWNISEYIPVTSGNYVIKTNGDGNTAGFCLYDNSKTYIRGEGYAWRTNISITVGANEAYLRMTYKPNRQDQFEEGSTATPYIPYGYADLNVYDSNDTLVSTTPIPLPSKGWAGSLPDGTADTLTIDSAGQVKWVNNAAHIASYNGESVGSVYMSTTGQLTTGAEVYYKQTPTTESSYITLPTIPAGGHAEIPELDAVGIDYWIPAVEPLVEEAIHVNEHVLEVERNAAYDLQVANNVYSGRNIAEIPEIAAEVVSYDAPWLFLSARIAAQDYSNLRIGDYFIVPLTGGADLITQSSVRYDIAAFEHYYNCGNPAMGHHIVCVPHEPILMAGSSYAMYNSCIKWNTTKTNQGNSSQANPYMISYLHEWEIVQYLTQLPSTLQAKLISFINRCESRYSSGNSLSSSTGSSWASLGKIWAPSEIEVYGYSVNGTPKHSYGIDSQFPIFRHTKDRIRGDHIAYWLRIASDASTTNACSVTGRGMPGNDETNAETIRPLPCFLLGA